MAVITKTLRSSGGDYTSLTTWEATEQTDLVSAGDSHVLECYNDWPSGNTTSLNLGGWTTSATNTITLKAAAGEGHGGSMTAGDGFWVDAASGATILISTQHVTVEEFYVVNSGAGTGGYPYRANTANITFSKCIAVQDGAGGSPGFDLLADNVTLTNCVALLNSDAADADSAAGFRIDNRWTTSLYNCTAIDGKYGFDIWNASSTNGASNAVIRNCVAYGQASACFAASGGYDYTSDSANYTYNASEDTTAVNTGAVTGITSSDFVDYANGDYTPAAGGALAGAGTDLSAFFLDDITGATR